MLFVRMNEKIERFCEEGGNNRGMDEEAEDEEREREPLNEF